MTDLEQVKQKIDIVDFINGYVKLTKKGRNFVANCPFHQEDTPSFIVSPDKQIWHCFGCAKGGDIFKFLMEYENIEFKEALSQLAEKAGIKIKYSQKENTYQNGLENINEDARKVYQFILGSSAGKSSMEYLLNRGLKKATIEDFEIGFAPDAWDILYKKISKKYDKKTIADSGLFIPSKKSGFFDRFRSRIMFPIRSQNGKIAGFSGRVFDPTSGKVKLKTLEPEKVGKYVNSPDSAIYNKSQILYGLNYAKSEILKNDFAIIVEGQFDVVLAHQSGFKNTVAVSGSSLTDSHLDLLSRYSKNIIFAYDSDNAGQMAAKRSIELAHLKGFIVSILSLEKGKDPADILAKDPKVFEKALKRSLPAIDFYIKSIKDKYNIQNLTSVDKKNIAKELLIEIAKLRDDILKADYIKKLSSLISIEEKYLYSALEKQARVVFEKMTGPRFVGYNKKSNEDYPKSKSEKIKSNQALEIENKVLGILLMDKDLFKKYAGKIELSDFVNQTNRAIAQLIKKLYTTNSRNMDLKLFENKLPKNVFNQIQEYILVAETEYSQVDQKELEIEFQLLTNNLKGKTKDKVKSFYAVKIKEAEKRGDIKGLKKLLKELNNQIIS